jgi:hypothetical protein
MEDTVHIHAKQYTARGGISRAGHGSCFVE